ncbi:unnamed protein product (mitochondrion) [Plasmodiophora brassicae]|uniref:Rhodanese domain-containing protein n=1 Tax=Plasmodiophora brassicae TaxID=37360 RepID=A0A3P3YAP6_PLABS|nr:unnamed protein product [Plasmodiophora brassicae]
MVPREAYKWQTGLCDRLDLRGRIRVAREGINGTVSGTADAVRQYMEQVDQLGLFPGMQWKVSPSEIGHAFPSMIVSLRDTIVNMGAKLAHNPATNGRLAEASALAGRLQGKRVLMYCTGGIRCEMASSYLKSLGVDRVAQLHGGIHEYLKAYPDGGRFRGKNFVFDERIAIPSNDATVVGRCRVCSRSFDDYSQKRRCVHCRILVVCCDTCHDAGVPLPCDSKSPR